VEIPASEAMKNHALAALPQAEATRWSSQLPALTSVCLDGSLAYETSYYW
jgi:hypothetical protein